jgi:hypothetical protein
MARSLFVVGEFLGANLVIMGHLGALQITPLKNVDCSINSGWIGAMLV